MIIRFLAAGALALWGLASSGSAGAFAIDYAVTQGSEPSFRFSFLQGASRRQLGVWANNWDHASESRPDTSSDFFAALGIDMVGVPERTTLALLALAFAGLVRPLRRYQQRR